MVWRESGRKVGTTGPNTIKPVPGHVLLLSMLYSAPILLPFLSGWLMGALAVPAAYVLTVEGPERGRIQLAVVLLIVGAISLVTGRLFVFLALLPLFPLGIAFYQGYRLKMSPVATAGRGIFFFSVSWLAFWGLYGLLTGENPYQQLLHGIDTGFVAAGELYMKNSDLNVEMQLELTRVITGLRNLVPHILPGVLISTILVTVWMNLALFNRVLRKTLPGNWSWPPYSKWKLPDQLVWLPIGAAVCYLAGPGVLHDLGINGLIVSGVLYFFQGLAVFLHMLDRWKVPGYLRAALYIILIVQSYGLVLLSLLGLADIWLQLRPEPDPPEKDNQMAA